MKPDAVVVGAGPNGLAAALTLARAGRMVRVYEAAATAGGGCRTAELTRPGFRHDVCAAVPAMLALSPFFADVDLAGLGVRLCTPEIAYAHPLDEGRAVLGWQDLERTAAGLGRDGAAWRRLFGPLVRRADDLFADVLGDLRHLPGSPLLTARFGAAGVLPARALARTLFRQEPARALFAGLAAHSLRRLTAPFTGAFGLALGTSAHVGGWPVVEGGSGRLVEGLTTLLDRHGVELVCDSPVTSLRELPPAGITLLDIAPHRLLDLAGPALPRGYADALRRFRRGPGVFKVDYALSGPVPWANPGCRRAGTLHLGGSLAEVTASEAAVERGEHTDAPYVLVVQPGVVDPTRAPRGGHTLWAYCHVPSGSTRDRTTAIEAQIERFAPGFQDVLLARHTLTSAGYEAYDANYVGGDIGGGRAGWWSSLLGPVPQWSRYATPLAGVYLCSASTPPGPGIHGMCGYNAAREALAAVRSPGRSGRGQVRP